MNAVTKTYSREYQLMTEVGQSARVLISVAVRYWNWSLCLGDPYDLEMSALFDGSPTSLSNNGVCENISAIVVGGVGVFELNPN